MQYRQRTDSPSIVDLSMAFACTALLFGLGLVPGLPRILSTGIAWILLVFALFIYRSSLAAGFAALFRGKPVMDSVICVCVVAIAGYGLFDDLTMTDLLRTTCPPKINLGVAVMIMFLNASGKYIERESIRRTSREAAKLMALERKTVTVVRDGNEETIPPAEIRPEDIVVVPPGTVLLVDGIIVTGETTIDASVMAGERFASVRRPGDRVLSGSINLTGTIRVLAQKVQNDAEIADIRRLVEAAIAEKNTPGKLVDRISGWVLLAALSLSALVGLAWIAHGQLFPSGLYAALSVMAVASPCALGLAAPLTVFFGSRRGEELGIFITSESVFELGRNVDTVVINKRGTITEGKPSVTDIISLSDLDDNDLLAIAASVQALSEFPLASAIVSEAKRSGLAIAEPERIIPHPGKGIETVIRGKHYYSGGPVILQEHGIDVSLAIPLIGKLAIQGKIPFTFGCDGKMLGIVAVSDAVRKGSREAIAAMKTRGIEVVMLTNENADTAEGVRKMLGISRIFTEFRSEGKASIVREMKAEGRTVAMIGDSVNDAPALATADIGIQFGDGPTLATPSVGMMLKNGHLMDALIATELVRSGRKTIRENIAIALFFGIIAIPASAGAFMPLAAPFHTLLPVAVMGLGALAIALNSARIGLLRQKSSSADFRRR